MRKYLYGVKFILVSAFILHSGLTWGGQLHSKSVRPHIPYLDGSRTPTIRTTVSCYDAFTGERLNCFYTLNLSEGEVFSGGHQHNDNRPIGKLRKSGDRGEGDIFLSGNTLYSVASFDYLIPEVAGKVLLSGFISPPPAYGCSYSPDCSSENANINIAIPRLQPLPNSSEYHITVRGGTDTHPDGTWGTSDTINKLEKIAKEYFNRSGRILSVNDLSLPDGGLFDLKADWSPPHKTHRTGTDADINRGGVNCFYDKDLRFAVGMLANGQSRPHLLCEDAKHKPVPDDDPKGIYKHIDFD